MSLRPDRIVLLPFALVAYLLMLVGCGIATAGVWLANGLSAIVRAPGRIRLRMDWLP